MKRMLFFFVPVFMLYACGKQDTYFLTVKGRVINAYSKQPIAGYHVLISYVNVAGGEGFNFGDWSDISSCNTDSKGYFTLTTPYALSRDTVGYYKLESTDAGTYSGFGIELNAAKAEAQRTIALGDMEIDKIVTLTLTVHHTGAANNNDGISGTVGGTGFFYNGSDSVNEDTYLLLFNRPSPISWNYRKDNVFYGPFTDTIIPTNSGNKYSIKY